MKRYILLTLLILSSFISFSQELSLSKETVTEYQRLMKVMVKKHREGVKKIFKIQEFSKLCLAKDLTGSFNISFSDSSWIHYEEAAYDHDPDLGYSYQDRQNPRSYSSVRNANKAMGKWCYNILDNSAIVKTEDDSIFWKKVAKIHRGTVHVRLCGNCR